MGKGLRQRIGRGLVAVGGRGGALVILLVLIVAFSVLAPSFFSTTNLLNIPQQYAYLLILACGQTIVIISRGIDLSVASTAALSGVVMGVAYAHWALPEPVALLLGLAAGGAVGLFNGLVITKWKIPDFVATLGTLTAVRGVALLVSGGLPIPNFEQTVDNRTIPQSVLFLASDSVLGVPVVLFVALVCVLLVGFVLSRTKLGRAAYAIGGNPEAARMSGIKVERTKVLIYVLSALLAAIAGFMLTGRQGSANALMASTEELQSIAAVVVGGTALFGGEGKISGTLIGLLVIAVLANGLNILGLAEFWQQVFNGLIIVAVVALDQWRRRFAAAQSTQRA